MAQHSELERLLTIDEAAKILNVSPKTVRRRIDAGDLPVIRDERVLRITQDDLRRYVSRHRFG